ncbi:hypothetical protein G9P44_002667 [Scheffersomyces stipitis]|nr:hypothetical protein G9P44_002667 [Scheffersomyces stipitis]
MPNASQKLAYRRKVSEAGTVDVYLQTSSNRFFEYFNGSEMILFDFEEVVRKEEFIFQSRE